MRLLLWTLGCSFALLACPSWGQGIAPLTASDLVLQQNHFEIEVLDAQRSVVEHTQVFEALSVHGAQQITTNSLNFQKDGQELEILEAYTAKKDGRHLPVTDPMIDRQSGVLGGNLGANLPNTNLWLLHYPDVQPGDQTVLRYRQRTSRTVFPGWHNLWWLSVAPYEIRSLRFALKAPASLPWHVHASGMTVRHQQSGGQDQWEISGRLPAQPAIGMPINRVARAPGVMASTFASPEQVGDAFARAMSERSQATPKVRELAATILAGRPQDRDPVETIYDWVRENIRYSASYVDFNAGWVGHDLDAVIASRQGDCKDIAALLIALLRTQSIEAEPALVNIGDEYELLPVGTPQFTHVLLHLPTQHRYLDTTSTDLPAGQLPVALQEKPVVLARAGGSAIARIPAPTPQDFAIESAGNYTLDREGGLSGSASLQLVGIPAWTARRQLQRIPPGSEGTMAVSHMLSQASLVGTGKLASRFDARVPRQEVTVQAQVDGFLPSDATGQLAVDTPLPLMGNSLKERLAALARLDARGPYTVCFPMKIHERFTLTLDPGTHVDSLPAGLQIEEPRIRYASRYSLDGRVLSVERDYLYQSPSILCSRDDIRSTRATLSRVMRDLGTRIAYRRDRPDEAGKTVAHP